MSFLKQITPLILTFNEEVNIGRTLGKLTWASRVIVVDSFSTDRTLEICAGFPNVEVVQRTFESFSSQINHALSMITTGWSLVLGADYVLTDEIIAEMDRLAPAAGVDAYIARFKYCIFGRPLRGSLYPPRELVVRCATGRYAEDGHGERLVLKGRTERLSGWVWHDDHKPLGGWIASQDRYARLECEKLSKAPPGTLNLPDRIRSRTPFAPLLVMFYCLFAKGLILDGWPGWFYVTQRMYAEMLISLRLLEKKLLSCLDRPQ